MFKIQNGKICGTNFLFAFPEGFILKSDTDFLSCEALEFISDGGNVKIQIYLVKDSRSAQQDTQDIIEDSGFIKIDEFVSVIRGNGMGIGVCYKSPCENEEHYEERYDFNKNIYGETQLDIDISLRTDKSKPEKTIYQALEFPAVKSFLQSIEYIKNTPEPTLNDFKERVDKLNILQLKQTARAVGVNRVCVKREELRNAILNIANGKTVPVSNYVNSYVLDSADMRLVNDINEFRLRNDRKA
ncbi:MAG: hypothetical protein HDP34_02855 [Clostridia bacterium]|nr:hypothetical protein [Clostridia bacterium]